MTERYHIIRLIAKDQLGGTYLAEDKELKRNIIFKHFDKGHGSEPEPNWEDAFTQYATQLSALIHPNLIAVHDFDIDDDHPVIITQYVEADTISECLQRDSLGVIETVNMALDLLTGLQAAHAGGIFHGAMHTGSVKRLALANGRHHYLIIDLGWKHLSSIIMGKETHLEDPVLIPPEIFGQPDAANAQSDLFMIGQLCFTTLAGGHPFAEHTPEQCAAAYQAGEMPPLATFVDNIPSELTDWISSMTMSDPMRRPASVQEAINALQAIDFSKNEVKQQPPSPAPPPTNTTPPPPSFSLATPKAVVIEKKTSRWQKKSVTIAALLIFVVDHIKATTPGTLEERNLYVNETKTEEYSITKEGDDKWKSCKLLGSLLDTEKDINRRKILAIAALRTLQHIFKSRKNSTKIKLRTFHAYVASVFLYNSELWTITKKLESTIDTFQRRHLRNIIGIHWPKKISNKELYAKTKTEPWSTTIKRRRMNWLGHLMRLHPDTPARQSLTEYLRKVKRPKGRPQYTWMEQIRRDLATIEIKLDYTNPTQTIDQLRDLAQDRDAWRSIVKRVVLQASAVACAIVFLIRLLNSSSLEK